MTNHLSKWTSRWILRTSSWLYITKTPPSTERSLKINLGQLNINRSRWRDYLRVSLKTCINHQINQLRKISPQIPVISTTLWTENPLQSIQTLKQDECKTMTYTKQPIIKNKWTHCLPRKWLCMVQITHLICRKPPWNFTNCRWSCKIRWQSRPIQLVKDKIVLISRESRSSQMPNSRISTIKWCLWLFSRIWGWLLKRGSQISNGWGHQGKQSKIWMHHLGKGKTVH